jgi:hypothetical protein
VYHDGVAWQALGVYAKGTDFGGWLYNPDDNVIQAIADLNGDGADDILITSPWGMGILRWQGDGLTAVLAAPKGTAFDGWVFNPDDNVILGTGDFDGSSGSDDILISSPWGIGMLRMKGSTDFGGWVYNPDDNRFEGICDLDGNGRQDVILTSPWGIGIFTLQGSTLAPIVMQPSGTSFEGWVYNPDDNVIQGAGDFDGNGSDDILISSPWGMAMLKQYGSSLSAIMNQPKGTWFDGWLYNPDDNTITGIGDLDGDGHDDILISSPWGIGVLTLWQNTLTSLDVVAYGNPLSRWYLTATNQVCDIVPLSGSNHAGILFKR